MMRPLRCRSGDRALLTSLLAAIAAGSALIAPAGVATTLPARIERYLMSSGAEEAALARSAAPPSVSAHATVLVLGSHGYSVAARGSNGFVCLVARSWDYTVGVKPSLFWDPRFRAPYCFNPAGARSVLPRYLMKTRWVIAGASERAIDSREKAAWAAGKIGVPDPGAMSYMMSKGGRQIGGQAGPWRPHVMFYFPSAHTPRWGANLPGNPIVATTNGDTAVFYVLVPVWSDGSPAPPYK